MPISSQCAGDDFTTKYNLYGDMIFKLCIVYLGNTADAEELMHDVFFKLLYRSPEFRDGEHEKYWLIRTTINCCKDWIKSYWRKKTVPLGDIEIYHQEPRDLLLAEAIFNLHSKYKSVIHMFYFEGYSVQEISQILKIGVSAVKMRLKRGREQLKIELEESDYEAR